MERKSINVKKWFRILIGVLVLAILFVGGFLLLYFTGLWEKFNSVDKVRILIQELGFWGRFTFFLLQVLQVTIIPIPSTVLTIAGAIVFGPLQGALLSLAGILLGSALAFLLGQTFGKKLVAFMVGKENCEKWSKFLSKAKYSFVIMMLLPMFPDDILCLVAGLTDMSWAFFMATNLIARPIGVFLTSFLGSGDFIPYSGWGLAVWGVILLISGFAIYFSTKYQKDIEKILIKKFHKKHLD